MDNKNITYEKGWWIGQKEPPYEQIVELLNKKAEEERQVKGEYGEWLIAIEAAQAIEILLKEKDNKLAAINKGADDDCIFTIKVHQVNGEIIEVNLPIPDNMLSVDDYIEDYLSEYFSYKYWEIVGVK